MNWLDGLVRPARSIVGFYLALWSCALFCFACSTDVAPSNPFDPDTPIQLQAPGSIAGTIRSRDDAAALEGAVVELDGTEGLAASSVTGQEGTYAFEELMPGAYVLSATHVRHIPGFRQLLLAPGEQLDTVDVTLDEVQGLTDNTGRLTGTVLLEVEQALPEQDQNHSGILIEVEGAGVRTVTNRAGIFDLFLNQGTYSILFSADNHHPSRLDNVLVIAGQDNQLSDSAIVLSANPGVIEGMVELEDVLVDGHADVQVLLENSEHDALSDPTGHYVLGGVPAGTYTLVATKDGYDRQSVLGVVVEGGRTTTLSALRLLRSRGNIHGVVELAGREQHGGVLIELSNTNFRTVSSQSGEFVLASVPVGVYELSASMQGYRRAVSGAVTVLSGQTTELAQPLVLSSLVGDFAINDGASYTNQVAVELDFSKVSQAVQMKIEGDLAQPDAEFRDFIEKPTVNLSVEDGLKVVLARFRTADNVESGPFEASITLDQTPPEWTQVIINAGADTTNAADGIVSLSFAATDETSGVQDMEVANRPDGFLGLYEPVVALRTHTLGELAQQGEKTVYVHFRDFAGNRTVTPASDSIVYDTLPPALNSFQIDFNGQSDAVFCNSPLVTLSITSPDAVRMRLSNQSGFPGALEEPFADSHAWFLAPSDGEKTVYLELVDAAGNVAGPFSDSIELDTQAPNLPTLQIASGAVYTNTAGPEHWVEIELQSTGANEMRIATDGLLDTEGWESFQQTSNRSLPTSDGPKQIVAQVRDQAKNQSAVVVDSIILDTTPPQILSLRLEDGSGYVTSADGSATVYSVCDDLLASPHELTLRITDQDDATLYTGDFQSQQLVQLGSDEGPRSVVIECSDPAGNQRVSDPVALLVDHSPPVVELFTLNGGSDNEVTSNRQLTVHISVSDDTAGGVLVALAQTDMDCRNASYLYPATGEITYTIDPGDGLRTLYLCAKDAAENVTTAMAASNSVNLDTTPPVVPQLSRLAISHETITLEWTPGGPDVAGYVLEQRIQGQSIAEYIAIATPAADETTFIQAVDPNNIGLHHYYRLQAYDQVGNQAAYSNELDAGAPILPLVANYQNSIDRRRLVWSWPEGTERIEAIYRYESFDGYVYEEAVGTNASGVDLVLLEDQDLINRRFNETVEVANTNDDTSLSWQSTYLFGTLRIAVDWLGMLGTYSDVAVDSLGIAHLVYYDDFHDDLRYIKLEPNCMADLATCAVVLDDDGNPGRYVSIAIDSQDIPHISYQGFSDGSLRYIKLTPTCLADPSKCVKTLDAGSVYNSSLALDQNDVAHIAYSNGGLKYLKLDGGGEIEDLDSNAGDISLDIDHTGVAHIVYSFYDGSKDFILINYIRMQGDKKPEMVGLAAEEEANGRAVVKVDDSGQVHIAYSYFDGGSFFVQYLQKDNFGPVTIDEVGPSTAYIDMVLGADGIARLAYYDSDTDEKSLKVAKMNNECFANIPNCPVLLDNLGDVGRYVSLDIDAFGHLHLSYVDNTLSMLRYYRLEQTPHAQSVDSAGMVGLYPSVAVGANGVAQAVYYDNTNNRMMSVRLDGISSPQIADGSGSVGYGTTMVIDSQGIAHIVYQSKSGGNLWYLKQDGVSSPVLIGNTGYGNGGIGVGLAIDDDDIPHVSHPKSINGHNQLRYMALDDNCLADVVACSRILVSDDVGSSTAIDVDSTGLAHIAYYANYQQYEGALMYVAADGVSAPVVLDDQGTSGRAVAMAIDEQDVAHITYLDGVSLDLKYIRVEEEFTPIVLQADVVSVSAIGNSIAIAPDGIAQVAYYDRLRGDVRLLRIDGYSQSQIVDKDGNVGQYVDLVIDDFGTAHMVYYDVVNQDLKYLRGSFAKQLLPISLVQR